MFTQPSERGGNLCFFIVREEAGEFGVAEGEIVVGKVFGFPTAAKGVVVLEERIALGFGDVFETAERNGKIGHDKRTNEAVIEFLIVSRVESCCGLGVKPSECHTR